jgi:hypothetical protein
MVPVKKTVVKPEPLPVEPDESKTTSALNRVIGDSAVATTPTPSTSS